MRWGRGHEGEEHTSGAGPRLFPPVNPAAARVPVAEDEAVVPEAADAPAPLPDEHRPVPYAAERVAPAVAAELGDIAGHEAGEDDEIDPVDPAVAGEESVPVATPPRAGRNLWVAAGMGVLLGVGSLAAAYVSPLAFAVVIYGFCIAALVEWRTALANRGVSIPLVPVLLATAGMGVATWFGRAEGLVIALLVAAAGIATWRVVDDRVENTLADALAGVFAMAWIPFLGSFVLLLELAEDGWVRVFIVVIAVVLNDTGALFSGMLLGRRKLAPRVSPKKTWEGAIGGAIVGTVGATVVAHLLLEGQWWVGAAVGLACVVAGVLGDLAESALKRDISIKDMSSAIPGHGGVLDRLDSILPAAAAAYVVFALLIGTS